MPKRSTQNISEARFRKLCDDTQAMSIQGYRADGTVVYWNAASEKIYGYSAEEALGGSLFELIIPEGMTDLVRHDVDWMFANRRGIPPARLNLKHKSGATVPVFSSHTVVDLPNDEPIMFCMDADLRALDSAEAEVQRLSYFDPLTDLPNRRLFLERLNTINGVSPFEKTMSALLLIDIDNFHSINDSLGYESGDQALIHCAKCLMNFAKTSDGLARLGKDEFTLLLPDLGNDVAKAATQAEQLAQCVLDEIQQPLTLNNKTHKLYARVGITLFDRNHNLDGNTILTQADIALKSAKRRLDSPISFFDKQMEASLHQRLHLSQALHHAVGNQQFQIAYQPQVNRYQKLISCEALLRWQHPEYGAISPAEFIPIAEANGSIIEIGEWVLQSCGEKLVEWSKRPEFEHLSLSINVSSLQFRQADFVDRVQDIITRTGADPKKMRFELTESLMAHDLGFIIEQMKKLRKLGISLSLDDFGTGYASLAYLTQLPLDELKIDRAFVNDLQPQSKGALLAETIISLGRSMNLAVIAEGVETQAQFERLQDLGCEFFQGYLFGRPSASFDASSS
ncbi:putative bifunctional diguanylate cyclase/phosphodiesterase [Pseudidiomarina halophila]|uniref:GGDEF domain-containing protein n=1 Tax=Pseudidiomarina halophila TaxID=1449799 RepID=A0A432XTB3_9GAMM|nr:GGDEF domain-containing phosphodiesterase [Pseudidiomarina halophila]RUO51967.1 hypothetical protein CWI69_10015 [Pseudidiomarina halophila]